MYYVFSSILDKKNKIKGKVVSLKVLFLGSFTKTGYCERRYFCMYKFSWIYENGQFRAH